MTRWRPCMGVLLMVLLRHPMFGQAADQWGGERFTEQSPVGLALGPGVQPGADRLPDAFAGLPAQPDSLFEKRPIRRSDWALSYLHYFQDGTHSAVTGGSGTEELSVKAPVLRWRSEGPKGHAWNLGLGTDMISSASTDRIDAFVSSASAKDLRSHVDLGHSAPWQQTLKARVPSASHKAAGPPDSLLMVQRTGRWFVGIAASVESDYLSFSVRGGLDGVSPDGRNAWTVESAFFRDDLRWGLLNAGYRKPSFLIYPEELRYHEWLDGFRRHSVHGRFAFSRLVDPRTRLGVEGAGVLQLGVLSTPFHRVYFRDASLRVEMLPKRRWRFPAACTAQRFTGTQTVLDARLEGFAGSFGVQSLALRLGGSWRFHPAWQVGLHLRGLVQDGSRHFAPYGQHDPMARYYSSDYDLSSFRSGTVDAALVWTPALPIGQRTIWQSVALRYAYFRRSDGLTAHWFNLDLAWSGERTVR